MPSPTQEEILNAFRSLIIRVPAVDAIIGSRLYLSDAGESPDEPYATFEVDGVSETRNHSGQNGRVTLDVSVELYEKTPTKATRLRDAVVDGIKGFSGDVSGTFLNRVLFQGESPFRDAQTKLFGRVLDFTIHA